MKDILDRAFAALQIKREGVDLTDDQYATGLYYLNEWLNSTEQMAFSFGTGTISSIYNELDVPDRFLAYVRLSIMVPIASEYSREMPATSAAELAREQKRITRDAAASEGFRSSYPSTFPRGTGITGGYGSIYQRAFHGDENVVNANDGPWTSNDDQLVMEDI